MLEHILFYARWFWLEFIFVHKILFGKVFWKRKQKKTKREKTDLVAFGQPSALISFFPLRARPRIPPPPRPTGGQPAAQARFPSSSHWHPGPAWQCPVFLLRDVTEQDSAGDQSRPETRDFFANASAKLPLKARDLPPHLFSPTRALFLSPSRHNAVFGSRRESNPSPCAASLSRHSSAPIEHLLEFAVSFSPSRSFSFKFWWSETGSRRAPVSSGWRPWRATASGQRKPPARRLAPPWCPGNHPIEIRGFKTEDTVSPCVFLLRVPGSFANCSAVLGAWDRFRFPILKTYSCRLKPKCAFHYLQFCHWVYFAHKIFILTPFSSIQILLDLYLRALHVSSIYSLFWNLLFLQ